MIYIERRLAAWLRTRGWLVVYLRDQPVQGCVGSPDCWLRNIETVVQETGRPPELFGDQA